MFKQHSNPSSFYEKASGSQIKSDFVSHFSQKFEVIRQMDKISKTDLMESLSIKKNRKAVFRAGQGAGKSGSFFFFSYDNRFLIKTLTNTEMHVLFSMLDQLIEHFRETKNKSILARIYGVFTLKTNVFGPVNLMIMQNSVFLKDCLNDTLTFDLKGSYINRYSKLSKEDTKFWRVKHSHKKVFKDCNFIEIQEDTGEKLVLAEEARNEEITKIIKKDTEFLAGFNVMDYSLLLVVEKLQSQSD